MSVSLGGGGEERSRRYHLVKWNGVKLSLEQGCLGLRSFVEMNTTYKENGFRGV